MDPSTVELKVSGMHCTSCAQGIERQLHTIGVADAEVSFATSLVRFSLSKEVSVPSVVAAIRRMGYEVVMKGAQDDGHQHHHRWTSLRTLVWKVAFSSILTLPLLLHMVLPFHFLHSPYVQLALTTPVFILATVHFGRSALMSLIHKFPNMDVLIYMGILASFFYSLTGTVLGLGQDYLFYETTATITTFVLIGSLCEHLAIRKTTSAVDELVKLQPERARRILPNGTEADVNVSEIMLGDQLRVNSGDRVPTDSVIVQGHCSVDESMLSGESFPVDKNVDEPLFGGTILLHGSVVVRATALGEQTVLGRIIELVRSTASRRPAIQVLGDRVSAVFVPVVSVIAVMTFFGSLFILSKSLGDSLLCAVAVLVIACPCAMGLATPTAIMIAVGRAAKQGVLIKGGDTIEKLARIRAVIFDKTGTLTQSELTLHGIQCDPSSRDEVVSLIRSLEQHSSHPIARSLRRELGPGALIKLHNVTETRGVGIQARAESGDTFNLGSYSIARHLTSDRTHSLYLVKNEATLIATVDLGESIKPGVPSVIEDLSRTGTRSALLSGDSDERCHRIADLVGIKEVHSEKTPEQKLTIIEQFQERGFTAYVGDGINDSPALTKADVGISLSTATDAAIKAAQVILLHGDISRLTFTLSLAKKTYRTIQQNLFWAFFYNVVAIPLAALGYLNPTVAAVAMGFSDVVVIGNSLRLRYFLLREREPTAQ